MEKNFLKNDEYRPNVAIVILNKKGEILWCKRKSKDGWQFPQGGIDKNETPKQAVLRETKEEVGLGSKDIKIICELSEWLKYDVPKDRRPTYFFKKNKFRGQVQRWFMAELTSHESKIDLGGDKVNEFSDWMWASYWYALSSVVYFKKKVYRQALTGLLPEYNQFIFRKGL